MNGNYVVLILGILTLAFAAYATHTVVRSRAAARAQGEAVSFRIGTNTGRQVIEEVRSAGTQRGLVGGRLDRDVERAEVALGAEWTLRPSRCLWVDSDPDAVVHERRMVELLRADVDVARTTNQALQHLVGRRYDVIVTNLTRPIASGDVDDRAGIKLLKMLAGAPAVPPVVVYAELLDGEEEGDAGTGEGGEGPGDGGERAGAAGGRPAADLPRPRPSAATGADADPPAANDDEPPRADDAPETAEPETAEGADDGAAAEENDAADRAAEDGPPRAAPPAEPSDPRLGEARAAGARAAVTTPASVLCAYLDVVGST